MTQLFYCTVLEYNQKWRLKKSEDDQFCNLGDKNLQIGNKFQNVFELKNELSCIPIFQNGRQEKTHQASSRADREYAGNG